MKASQRQAEQLNLQGVDILHLFEDKSTTLNGVCIMMTGEYFDIEKYHSRTGDSTDDLRDTTLLWPAGSSVAIAVTRAGLAAMPSVTEFPVAQVTAAETLQVTATVG